MKNLLFAICFTAFPLILIAQTPESNAEVINPNNNEIETSSLDFDLGLTPSIYDGAYKRNVHLERVSLPLEQIREADVMWSKRIWREIDTKQKLNDVFVNEQKPFMEVLIEVIEQNENILIYADEKFEKPMDKNELWTRLYQRDTIEVWDIDTETYVAQPVDNEVNIEAFRTFRLKEDWIFDTKTSGMKARIIGLAPVRDVIDPNSGQIRGQENLFWIHYESLRPILAKYEAYNAKNNAITLSWTDLFDMRRFASVVTKEANNKGQRIKDYARGKDALREAERIDNEVRDFEFGLWSH